MYCWFQPENKFAAEALIAQGGGHGLPVRVNQFHHFFHCNAQFSINFCFVIAVNAALHQFRTSANKAFIFIGPFYKFCIARGLCLDLLAR